MELTLSAVLLEIISNEAWVAESNQNFLAVGPNFGAGNSTSLVTIFPNPNFDARSANITLNGASHTVLQAGTGVAPATPTPTPAAVNVDPPKVKTKKSLKTKKSKVTIRLRVTSQLPGLRVKAKASGGAKVRVKGKNPYKIVVQKLKRPKTSVRITLTDSRGQTTKTKVVVKKPKKK